MVGMFHSSTRCTHLHRTHTTPPGIYTPMATPYPMLEPTVLLGNVAYY